MAVLVCVRGTVAVIAHVSDCAWRAVAALASMHVAVAVLVLQSVTVAAMFS